MQDDTEKIKACPKCDNNFKCSPADCWCAKLPPAMPMVEGASCFCPTCLEKLISAKLNAAKDIFQK